MTNYFKDKVAAQLLQARLDTAYREQKIADLRYFQKVGVLLMAGIGLLWLGCAILRSWQTRSLQLEWPLFAKLILLGGIHGNQATLLAALEAIDS